MQRAVSVSIPAALALLALGACEREARDGAAMQVTVPEAETSRYDSLLVEEQRLDPAWRAWAERDRLGRLRPGAVGRPPGAGAADTAAPATNDTERYQDIRAETVNRPPALPVQRTGGGPSILHVQVLLDRANFSPGVLDGRWGKNTEKALYWFQHQQGLEPTGRVDSLTYGRLATTAGDGQPVMLYRVTTDDLGGPFVGIPEDVYEKAELACLCSESPLEALSERFHGTPELLARLNPGMDLANLREGTNLWVPDVREQSTRPAPGSVARIIVSKNGFYTHALDAEHNILFHFPSTLGSQYDPSPRGRFRVAGVVYDPHFHYQPQLFHEVPDHEPEATLEPGPNSPVGVVWIALSKPHYGIHGTSEPRTIGYVASHGCVRLTNWDARLLADHTGSGVPVEFR